MTATEPRYERYDNIWEIPEAELPGVELPAAMQRLTPDEATLAAILMDRSGIDVAEMIFVDEQSPTRCYRAYPFQIPWWRCRDAKQLDMGSRSIGKCLAKGTLITLANGSDVPIEGLVDREDGLRLLAWEPWGAAVAPARVERVFASGTKPAIAVVTETGRRLECTVDHQVLTDIGWAAAGDLEPGDSIAVAAAGRAALAHEQVTSIDQLGERDTFDITMTNSSTANFLANGIVVHNSESIIAQACAFPFNFPGQEFVIITPEGSHADALTERLEVRLFGSRLLREMLAGGRRAGVTHHPFQALFQNGARVFVRLPQRSGIGVKGCLDASALVLTRAKGLVPISEVQVGDEVWTHVNRWMPTTKVESFESDVIEVRGQGSYPVKVSGHHQFYGAWDQAAIPGKQARDLGGREWVRSDDLAAIEGRLNFHWAGPGDGAWVGVEKDAPVPGMGASEAAWWLVGRYIADGYTTSQVLKSGARGRRRVHWVAHPARHGAITGRLADLELHHRVVPRAHSSADVIEHSSGELAAWLEATCGTRAENKRLPPAAFTLPAGSRRALLEGYMSGDGATTTRPNGDQDRMAGGTASRVLAVGLGILAQGLGRSVGYSSVQPKVTSVMGVALKNTPQRSYRVTVANEGRGKGLHRDGYAHYKVRSAKPAGRTTVYNIVNDDHSYLANGIFQHNTHPAVLHIDEAQDISERTWNELPEVVRTDIEGHQTRAHGVSKGIQDDSFARKSQPGSGWTVHHIGKVYRPDLRPFTFVHPDGTEDWFTTNDADEAQSYARRNGLELRENWREEQAREYGGRESPDFKRNVYGVHGDAMNRIFILTRLMSCVDVHEGSEYNVDEYRRYMITADAVAARAKSRSGVDHSTEVFDDEQAAAIVEMVDLPRGHLGSYETFWAGADIGVIGDPTELLVFAEHALKGPERTAERNAGMAVPKAGLSQLKLVCRIQLLNVAPDLQAHLFMHVINHYRPKALSLDRTGNGIAILRALQRLAGTARVYVLPEADEPITDVDVQRQARTALTVIKGYNFSEKVVIEIDERIVEDRKLRDPQQILDQAGVRQHAKDAATDTLREWVDGGRLRLPYDGEVINQMNGQTWQYAQEPINQYGKRRQLYSMGDFHILDAARMAALGMELQPIEAIIAATRRPHRPVLDRIG